MMNLEEESPKFTRSSIDKRQRVIESARKGDFSLAKKFSTDSDPRVRSTSISVLSENLALDDDLIAIALLDPHPMVRSSLARAAATNISIPVLHLLDDVDASVVEVACWAVGEQGETYDLAIEILSRIALDHDDALCRESAVASLGALGDLRGLKSILQATRDIATVRRRAVIALAPFEGEAVTDALETALSDRDWQVRQAAEDLSQFFKE
jgi:HEAT repeat protein